MRKQILFNQISGSILKPAPCFLCVAGRLDELPLMSEIEL